MAMADARRWTGAAIVASCLAVAALQAKPAAGQEVKADEVRGAIERGKQFLLSEQQSNGGWIEYPTYPGGSTALCLLGLLNCGADAKNPRIKQGLERLSSIPANQLMTYTVSLRLMALAEADPTLYRAQVKSDVDWLLAQQMEDGGWGYPRGNWTDASNTQFALLALHEARQLGIEIPAQVWRAARQYWDERFDPRSGGFGYHPEHRSQPYGSMTCAGISSLIIIDENLKDAAASIAFDESVKCCGQQVPNDRLQRAIAWMEQNMAVHINPGNREVSNMTRYYYLYGLERAGRLAGIRFFGKYDWYRLGASALLKQQSLSGEWVGVGGLGESDKLVTTAFALLFLSKGKRPIVVGKYKYNDDPAQWDPHRNGVHYLTRQLEQAWKLKLNWQTIDAAQANADDLNEAEVLILTGRDALNLSGPQKQALKVYIESGKLLLAEAAAGDGCGDDRGFDRSFRQLVEELFPGSRLTPLEPLHPVWNSHFPLNPVRDDPNNERPLYGLQASCRTSVIYCSRNLSCLWELNQPAAMQAYPERARRQIEYATRLGINIVAYATGRQVHDKGDKPPLLSGGASGLAGRTLEIPKLGHGGGADDAPNAWRNVMTRLRFDMGMEVVERTRVIDPQRDELSKFAMLFLHGRQRYEWSGEQRVAIKQYLENGGFLFADSICASSAFADAFRGQIGEMFPGSRLEPLPADHPLLTEQYFGYDIRRVTLRLPDENPQGVAGFVEQPTAPVLEALTLANGRIAVVFSPYDLSCALENAAGSQCKGYSRDDASRIGVNVVLFALGQAESSPAADGR